MRIEIICTGDEILTGKTVNTNFSHISRKLEEAGLSVSWGTTVGDDRDTPLEAFRLAGDRGDAVIVNGGLGPTVDDLWFGPLRIRSLHQEYFHVCSA
jgi:nicotinamide-nucleotide amidase